MKTPKLGLIAVLVMAGKAGAATAEFIGPNERYPNEILKVGIPPVDGVLMGVGTERLYFEALLLGADGIAAIDYEKDAVLFHEINRELFHAAGNAAAYRRLRLDPTTWPKEGVLSDPRWRDWWRNNVVNSGQFTTLHKDPVALRAEIDAMNAEGRLKWGRKVAMNYSEALFRIVDIQSGKLLSQKDYVKREVKKYDDEMGYGYLWKNSSKAEWIRNKIPQIEGQYASALAELHRYEILNEAGRLKWPYLEARGHYADRAQEEYRKGYDEVRMPYEGVNYLYDESLYQKLRAMAERGRIHAFHGDLRNSPQEVIEKLRALNLSVGAVDFSNAWDGREPGYPGVPRIQDWLRALWGAKVAQPGAPFIGTSRHGDNFYYRALPIEAAIHSTSATLASHLESGSSYGMRTVVSPAEPPLESAPLRVMPAPRPPVEENVWQRLLRFCRLSR